MAHIAEGGAIVEIYDGPATKIENRVYASEPGLAHSQAVSRAGGYEMQTSLTLGGRA